MFGIKYAVQQDRPTRILSVFQAALQDDNDMEPETKRRNKFIALLAKRLMRGTPNAYLEAVAILGWNGQRLYCLKT
jgi:hypothetical protein